MSSDKSFSPEMELLNLLKKLVYNFVCLIVKHIKFLKEEIKEETTVFARSIFLLIFAAFTAYLGIFFSGVFLIIVLSIFIPIWLSVLIVTALYLLIPLILIIYSLSQLKKFGKRKKIFVNTALKTLEESKKWLEHLKS